MCFNGANIIFFLLTKLWDLCIFEHSNAVVISSSPHFRLTVPSCLSKNFKFFGHQVHHFSYLFHVFHLCACYSRWVSKQEAPPVSSFQADWPYDCFWSLSWCINARWSTMCEAWDFVLPLVCFHFTLIWLGKTYSVFLMAWSGVSHLSLRSSAGYVWGFWGRERHILSS